MRELLTHPRRLALVVAALAVLTLLTLARGLVALAALTTTALVVCLVGMLLPLLRDDGIDWDWLPRAADEQAPEPGIARLQWLLAPRRGDPAAATELQELVRRLAHEQVAPHGRPGAEAAPRFGDGPLARYLAGPPRTLTPAEAGAVLADLEHLTPTKESA